MNKLTPPTAPHVTPRQRLRQLQLMHFAVTGAMVPIAIASWFVFPRHTYPPVWVPWALGGYAAAAAALCATIVPATVRPLDAALPPEARATQGVDRFVAVYFTRMAIAASVGPLAYALAFVVMPQTAWTALIGLVLAVLVLLSAARPDRRLSVKVERRLDSAGAHSGLVAALFGDGGLSSAGKDGPDGPFGRPQRDSGPIQMH